MTVTQNKQIESGTVNLIKKRILNIHPCMLFFILTLFNLDLKKIYVKED